MSEGGARRARSIAAGVLTVVVVIGLVLADALALNQLTTQSSIDGIIQLTVVGAGMTGALGVLALVVGAGGRPWRWLAGPMAVIAVLALAGWRSDWPIGWAVVACAASAVVWAVAGARSVAASHTDPTVSRTAATVMLVQAAIYASFALLAAVEGRHVLFG